MSDIMQNMRARLTAGLPASLRCWHASTKAKKTAKNERGEERCAVPCSGVQWSEVEWRAGLKRRPAASAFLLDSFKPFAGVFTSGTCFPTSMLKGRLFNAYLKFKLNTLSCRQCIIITLTYQVF